MEMMMYSMLFIIPILISIAFLTLFERKILGLIQNRKGPNKVSLSGLLQPFADAVKLFTKEPVIMFKSNKMMFMSMPVLSMLMALMIWTIFSGSPNPFNWSMSSLTLILILGINMYPTLLSGWMSNSKYPLLGAIRNVAQTISYEISMAIILMIFIIFGNSLTITYWLDANSFNSKTLMFIFIGLWVLSLLAESNRTPFDFSEGESELVAGFMTEFSSSLFALIFMAEYSMILFASTLSSMMLTGSSSLSFTVASLSLVFMFFWMWVRGTLPRYRYDKLMTLAWKSLLPISLAALICMISVKST